MGGEGFEADGILAGGGEGFGEVEVFGGGCGGEFIVLVPGADDGGGDEGVGVVVDAEGVEVGEVLLETGGEVFVGGVFGGPKVFGEGDFSRESTLVEAGFGGDEFCPDVAWRGEDVLGLFGGEDAGRGGFEVVDAGEGDRGLEEEGHAVGGAHAGVLGVVEVAGVFWAHDDVVAGFGGGDTALHARLAGGDGSAFGEAAFEDFIPAEDVFVFGFEEGFDAFDEIGLEFVDVFEVVVCSCVGCTRGRLSSGLCWLRRRRGGCTGRGRGRRLL